jgi:hypothetical protein
MPPNTPDAFRAPLSSHIERPISGRSNVSYAAIALSNDCFQRLRCMAAPVKGCPMPALSRRCAKTRQSSAGRRRTSLEGGNRGEPRRGPGRLHSYGDLTAGSRPGRGDLASQPDGDIARMLRGGAARPDFSMTHRRRNYVTPGPGKAVGYRCRPMRSRRTDWTTGG